MIDTQNPEVSVSTHSRPADSVTVECRGFVYKDEDGRYCAYATRLPGVYGEGETASEAFAELCEAFAFAVEMYHEEGKSIPWRDKLIHSQLSGNEYWAAVNVKQTAVS